MSVDLIETLYNEKELSHGSFSHELGAYIEYIESSESWITIGANLIVQIFAE